MFQFACRYLGDYSDCLFHSTVIMFQVLEFRRKGKMPQYLLYHSLLQTLGKYRAAAWVSTLKVLLSSERLFYYFFLFPCSSDSSSVPVLQCSSGAKKVNCSAGFES